MKRPELLCADASLPGRTQHTAAKRAIALRQAGRLDEAIEVLTTHLERSFARRLDLVILEAIHGIDHRFHGTSPQSPRILRTELGLRIPVAGRDAASFNYLLKLADTLRGLPPPGWRERCYVLLSRLIHGCHYTKGTLSARRRMLGALLHLRERVGQIVPPVKQHRQASCQWLSALLQEPEQTVRNLLKDHSVATDISFCKRLLNLGHGREYDRRRHLAAFHWADEQAYIRFIHAPGSRVLLTIHMGDFIGAFNRIAAAAPPDRCSISLRRDRLEDANFLAAAHEHHRTLYHGEYNTLSIVADLRRGDCTLSVLFDLRGDFGETIPVSFFGRPARLVKGPALLAILGQAPVLPFVTFEEDGVDVIEMAAAIDPRPHAGESLENATRRLTQSLANLAERWIRRCPAQWKYLPLLPAYLVREAPHE